MVRTLRRSLLTSLFCVLLVLFFVTKANCQAAYGTIIGTVTDPSGAGVADATVTVNDIEKGVSQGVATNSSGYYTVTNLIPGNYRVSVEAKGFKKNVQQNVPVIVGNSTTVDVTLQLGR